MSIVSSGWLQRMVDKAGNTPSTRLQALFRILQDWSDVPGFRQQLHDVMSDEAGQHALKAYLMQLVEASKVTRPDMVAGQVHMILLGALNEELRQPGSQALEHARQAAVLLMTAQLPARQVAYGRMAIAASVVVLVGVMTLFVIKQQPEAIIAANSLQVITAVSSAPNPERVAALYNLHEQMQAANCSYPQALMLAPEQRAPFIENVVDGNVGDIKPESMVMVSQLYQKVDCYYPPAAMLL
jgi:hypothetical protein